uniref:F-box domain-containing protein n=1 Tax=Steinernema glaseri TaxID=37863 RepID=A0A1I8AQA4_9BILA
MVQHKQIINQKPGPNGKVHAEFVKKVNKGKSQSAYIYALIELNGRRLRWRHTPLHKERSSDSSERRRSEDKGWRRSEKYVEKGMSTVKLDIQDHWPYGDRGAANETSTLALVPPLLSFKLDGSTANECVTVISLNMDHLFYDLVEEVVSYLPRKDVNTIAKVAAKSQRLEKWSAAAEDQLENRFLLDVYVHFGRSKKKDAPKIYLSARRRIPDRGIDGYWNFRGWRYAWIRSVVVDATRVRYGLHYKYKPAEIDQVLRMVSLPVDPSIRTSLCCTATNDLAVKILLATQKGFATVEVSAESNHPDVFEDFAIDHLEHGVSLQKLTSYKGENICAAVAPLFRERRGKPLNIQLLGRHLDRWDMELIIDNWLQSDGTYEEKRLRYQSNFTQTKFTSWCKRRGIVTFAFGGYLAHPTRSSSLAVTN